MTLDSTAYGLWSLVLINTAVFAFSFARPQSGRDWRSFGAFSAFLVALFTEMYGFPLTLYLLSGWLGRRDPDMDLLTHNDGHLWPAILGWEGDSHLSPFHSPGARNGRRRRGLETRTGATPPRSRPSCHVWIARRGLAPEG